MFQMFKQHINRARFVMKLERVHIIYTLTKNLNELSLFWTFKRGPVLQRTRGSWTLKDDWTQKEGSTLPNKLSTAYRWRSIIYLKCQKCVQLRLSHWQCLEQLHQIQNINKIHQKLIITLPIPCCKRTRLEWKYIHKKWQKILVLIWQYYLFWTH